MCRKTPDIAEIHVPLCTTVKEGELVQRMKKVEERGNINAGNLRMFEKENVKASMKKCNDIAKWTCGLAKL